MHLFVCSTVYMNEEFMVKLMSGFHFFSLPFNFLPLDSERIRIRKKRFGFGFGKKIRIRIGPFTALTQHSLHVCSRWALISCQRSDRNQNKTEMAEKRKLKRLPIRYNPSTNNQKSQLRRTNLSD